MLPAARTCSVGTFREHVFLLSSNRVCSAGSIRGREEIEEIWYAPESDCKSVLHQHVCDIPSCAIMHIQFPIDVVIPIRMCHGTHVSMVACLLCSPQLYVMN